MRRRVESYSVNPMRFVWPQDTLEKYEERAEAVAAASGRKLRFLILDLSPVTDIDASAVHFLKVIFT